MKLVLVCTAVVLLMSAVELARSPWWRRNSIEEIYKGANITPVPEMRLEVDFGGFEVTLGMEISPAEAMGMPSIGFHCEPGCYYTCLGMSRDWPSPDDPYLSSFILGIYVNLYCNCDGEVMLADSCEIARWSGVSPPPDSKTHRYLMYAYKQNGMIDTTDKALRRLQYDRLRFQLSAFVRTCDLISPPIAGTIWYSQHPVKREN